MYWILGLAAIIAVAPAGVAFGQAEQPAEQERQQPEGQAEDPQQAEDQQQEGQQQDAVTGISMEGTLRAVDTEAMTLLVAVDPESIMASEGESLENVPELSRNAAVESSPDFPAEGEAGAEREPEQAEQDDAQPQEQQQAAEADADRPLLLFHYDDQTEVVGDIQRIEGLSEQPNTRVHIDYRAEGNRAIAERIEVLSDVQDAPQEGREAEAQEEEPDTNPDR
jgi:hypothetical protein